MGFFEAKYLKTKRKLNYVGVCIYLSGCLHTTE